MRDDLVGEGPLFEPDVMLPAQYFAVLRRSAPQGPEHHLILAMLKDAIECVQKHRCAVDPSGRELYEDARDWIDSRDRTWPFSFENVCGFLNLDPEYLRRGLSRWGEREDARRRSARVLPFTGRTAALDEPLPLTAAKAG